LPHDGTTIRTSLVIPARLEIHERQGTNIEPRKCCALAPPVPRDEPASRQTQRSRVPALKWIKHQSVLRLIDPHHFSGHTITVDQVVVPEDADASWVVLRDDAVLVREEVPVRWHANALGADVEQR
jgi:hypothetical protein